MSKISTLLTLVLLSLSMSGCACWNDEAKKNTLGCIIARDIVDCTTSSFKDSVPYFASIVGGLISGGTPADQIPWDSIVAQAEAMGIKDGGCFLAELKNALFSKPAGSPEFMAKRNMASDALSQYKRKHFPGISVKFRIFDKKSGKTVEL